MMYKGVKCSVVFGDLTEEETDAIVNTSNGILEHGSEMSKRLIKKGGNTIV